MIEEIRLEEFPWDEIPWARDENESRYIPGYVTQEATVLFLWQNDKRVAYLVYDVRINSGYVDIHYAQTWLPFQRKGCASKLMSEVIERHGGEYDFHVYETSSVSHGSLNRWGFEKVPGKTLWIRKKTNRPS